MEKGEGEEYIPLREYLLRHDKAIFWVLESMIPFGNHPLFLFFLGWMLPPKPAFMKLTTTPTVRAMTFTKQVFQDIVLPINKLEEQINTSHTLFDTYPILVYPCRIYDHGKHTGQLRPPRPDQMVPGGSETLTHFPPLLISQELTMECSMILECTECPASSGRGSLGMPLQP